MYGKAFCKVYNEFGWNYFPGAFAGQLLLWKEQNGVDVKSVLDIGCGTGVLCGALADAGIEAHGVDLSESMIDIAKEQYPNASFEVANMVDYRSDAPVDLVTCTGDALNHIIDEADLAKVFANVHDSLKPGGYFICDLLNEEEVGDGEVIDFEYDETTNAKFSMKKGDDGMVCLNIDVYEGDEFKFNEQITEKVHDPTTICRMLMMAGFGQISIGHKLLEEQDGQAVTWFITAQTVGFGR